MPKVSFILPVFNGAAFLAQTIDSIISQTFKDWELIAINDGSTDGSEKILREYAAQNPRVRIISRENRGLIYTLNEAVQSARGIWLARIDADDICLPDRIDKQLAWAEKENADLCGGIIERIGQGPGHSWVFPSSTTGIYTWLLFRSAFAHPTIIIKRDLALKFPYSQEFMHAEDYELWTRLALANVPMTNIPEKVLLYRVHNEQVSTSKKDAQTDTRVRITKKYWENSPLTRGMSLIPCLVDERKPISRKDFCQVIHQLQILIEQTRDCQAKAAIMQHLTWFLYRSMHLDCKTVFSVMKPLPLSSTKKAVITLLTILKAGFIIDYCRNAAWIRWFPLKWFF
ncbi:MAG: glycosyltransferase family 2 protein [Candidatus Rifleibacteriota bacterium]